jgi:hypothetical protein
MRLLSLFSLALQPSAGYGLLVSRGFLITHNDAPQSVGLLRTIDQLIAESSTWQYTTHTTDKRPCPGGIRTHDRSRRAVVDRRLRRAATGTGLFMKQCGKNIVEPDKPQIRRMHIPLRATNTLSEYVILVPTAFSLQQLLRERLSLLRSTNIAWYIVLQLRWSVFTAR